MKLLHIGFSNLAMSRAFIKQTDEYRFIDWTDWTAIPNNIKNLHKHITDVYNEFKPDLVFMQIQTPDVITPEFIKTIKVPTINWTWDFRKDTPQWMVDIAPYVISAFTNETDPEYLRSLGHDAMFLQGGFDPDIYDPDGGYEADVEPVIVFMANNYPDDEYDFPLSKYRIELVDALKEKYGSKFAVYGFGWPGQNPLQSFMHREEKEAASYRSSKIAINLSHFEAERYTSDRMFRILGSGPLCMTHWYPGIEKDFTDGEHLLVWRTTEELMNLIDEYIPNINTERIRIAAAGCKLAHMNYTWDDMVRNIVDEKLNDQFLILRKNN